jgi:predicted transglutaminase-like protease
MQGKRRQLRLLVCHATSCATERNWSLWGHVYTAFRNALGIERGKRMSTICANSRQAIENDFAVALAVVEGDIEL